MKKLLLLILFPFFSSYGQNITTSYLGKDIEGYYGSTLKVSLKQKYYEGFLIKGFSNYTSDKFIYMPKKDGYSTKTSNQIFDKTFECIDVIKKDYNIYLKLLSDSDTIFFKYSDIEVLYQGSYSFPFQIIKKGTGFPDSYYCNDFVVNNSKFDNKKSIFSSGDILSLSKFIEDRTRYYLSLSFVRTSISINEKGVMVLLANGEKIVWEGIEIDTEATPDGIRYKGFVELDPSQMELISKYKITDFKLGIFEHSVDSESSNMLKRYATCIKDIN